MKESYLEQNFCVTPRAAGQARYADGDQEGLEKLGPFPLFIKYILTSSSGKEIEEIDKAPRICFLYKPIPSSKDKNDLSIGFHKHITICQRELTKIKTVEGIYYARIYLKDVFGYAEHHENSKYGLG